MGRQPHDEFQSILEEIMGLTPHARLLNSLFNMFKEFLVKLMPSSLPTSHLRVTLLLGAMALGLGFIPPSQVVGLRTHLLDALKPGLDGLYAVNTRWEQTRTRWANSLPRFQTENHQSEVVRLSEELETSQQQCRQLEIANARLHQKMNQLATTGPSPYPTRPGRPLVNVELLEAAVLNRENGTLWQPDRLLNRGKQDGLSEDDLVLDAHGPLIDQGEHANLAAGQPVYSGRCVVGRLSQVGRVVSSIQKVTDENYRGLAQLIRKTEAGFVFGAEGVIEGQGEEKNLCRLRYIAGTQPVEVGDAVYTGDPDGSKPFPMYYGKVVRAELSPGDQEWSIWVEPAIKKLTAPTVTVLRTQFDLPRSLTN